MEESFVQSRTSDVLAEVRSAAAALVDREEVKVRSRMLAYEIIGTMVGTSGMQIRRLVNGYPGATLNYVVGHNIMAVYRRVTGKTE